MARRLAIRKKQLETWTAIIQECRNSGMKTKDWLAENNISKDQYYYWFKQLRLTVVGTLLLSRGLSPCHDFIIQGTLFVTKGTSPWSYVF